MKKMYTVFLGILVLSFPFHWVFAQVQSSRLARANDRCADSDNSNRNAMGEDRLVRGTTSGVTDIGTFISALDRCESPTQLREFVCAANGRNYSSRVNSCPDGEVCYNGVCRAGAVIRECPRFDTQSNYVYHLDGDIQSEGRSDEPCFGFIRKIDVVLACNNHAIRGAFEVGPADGRQREYGIMITNSSRVVVNFCRISDFDFGIWARKSGNINILNNRVQNTRYGLAVQGASGGSTTTVDSNAISQSLEMGIVVGGKCDWEPAYRDEAGWMHGGYCRESSERAVVRNNRVEQNPGVGIELSHLRNVTVIGNTITGNQLGGLGLKTVSGENNQVKDNRIQQNGVYGIFLTRDRRAPYVPGGLVIENNVSCGHEADFKCESRSFSRRLLQGVSGSGNVFTTINRDESCGRDPWPSADDYRDCP